jgi:hypothetical protein
MIESILLSIAEKMPNATVVAGAAAVAAIGPQSIGSCGSCQPKARNPVNPAAVRDPNR